LLSLAAVTSSDGQQEKISFLRIKWIVNMDIEVSGNLELMTCSGSGAEKKNKITP
jgi:hypothetical protein